jgi:hypothetical protein
MRDVARLLSLFACLAAPACSSQGHPDSGRDAAQPTRRAITLEPGRTLVYDVDWTTATEYLPEQGPRTGFALVGGVRVKGRLSLEAVGEHEGGMLVAAQIEQVSHHEITIDGHVVPLTAEDVSHQPIYFVIEPDGHVPRLWFSPESSGMSRQLLAGLLERIDFRVAFPAEDERQVRVGQGVGAARYVEAGDGKVHRTLARLVRFDGIEGIDADALSIAGQAVAELDESRMPSSFEVKESASFALDGWVFDANESFSLALVRSDDRPPRPMPADLHAWASRDPSAPPDREEAQRAFAQQMAQDMTLGEIRGALVALEVGSIPPRRFMSKAAGLLRGWPETAHALLEPGRALEGNASRQLVFDILVAGGTTEAQAVMRELFAHALEEDWPELPLLVNRFGFLERPEPETVTFVVEVEAAARARGHDPLARSSLYTFGSLARQLEYDDPWAAASLHARLIEAFEEATVSESRVAAIAGLGNAGRPSDRARLLPLLHDPDDFVRAFTAGALRHMGDAEVEAALLRLLADADSWVASEALSTLDDHLLGPQDSHRLAAMALRGRVHPDVEDRLVNVLITRIEDDPRVVATLRVIAERTADHAMLARISRHLEHASG